VQYLKRLKLKLHKGLGNSDTPMALSEAYCTACEKILDSLKAHREGLLLDIGIPIPIVRYSAGVVFDHRFIQASGNQYIPFLH
jgi:hypothetical protein